MHIYYDGVHIERYPQADGITTNCSLMAGKTYRTFYESNREAIAGRPISFQTWEDDCDRLRSQIEEIHAIDPKIFVKVPIVNSLGSWNEDGIRFCVERSIPINVTAIYTTEQLDKARDYLTGMSAPIIISVFAGPISDTGVDPTPTLRYAKSLFAGMPASLLWAGCREVYTIVRAEQAGCDIITVPDSVYEKLADKTKTLDQLSVERVQKFRRDAVNGSTRIN
jgi:transaldolase